MSVEQLIELQTHVLARGSFKFEYDAACQATGHRRAQFGLQLLSLSLSHA